MLRGGTEGVGEGEGERLRGGTEGEGGLRGDKRREIDS